MQGQQQTEMKQASNLSATNREEAGIRQGDGAPEDIGGSEEGTQAELQRQC